MSTTTYQYDPELKDLVLRAAETPIGVAEKVKSEADALYAGADAAGLSKSATELGELATAAGTTVGTPALLGGAAAQLGAAETLGELSKDQTGAAFGAGETLANSSYQRAIEQAAEQRFADQAKQRASKFAGAGRAFGLGSSRLGIAQAVADVEAGKAQNEFIAQTRNEQFKTGLQSFLSQLQNRTSAASARGQIGQNLFQSGTEGFRIAQAGIEGRANAPYTALNAYRSAATPAFGPQIPNPVSSTTTNESSGGATVICTELHRQGILDSETMAADRAHGEKIRRHAYFVYDGYVCWAKHVVPIMARSKLFTRAISLVAVPWAKNMKSFHVGGAIVNAIGLLVCGAIGGVRKLLGVK